MAKTTVFGGWAVPPEILTNVFWGGADYIDINRMMPMLFDSSRRLRDDWVDVVISECRLASGNVSEVIGGWSTGAICAYAAALAYPPQKLILLSATPCFCRKSDFRFGTRPAALNQMIGALEQDKETVLQSFYDWSGLDYDPQKIHGYTVDELLCGLEFLKQVDLRPLTPTAVKPIFLHGTDDRVIPIAASKYFSDATGGEHIEIAGGHSFFMDQRMPPEEEEF